MFSHPVAIAFALICLFTLAVAVHIAWPTLQPVFNWLRLVARDLFGVTISLVVYLIYAIAILAAELWKFFASRATLNASRLAFRLFGAVDCCACKKRLRKPWLRLGTMRLSGSDLRIPNISHTYCKPCFETFTAQFQKLAADTLPSQGPGKLHLIRDASVGTNSRSLPQPANISFHAKAAARRSLPRPLAP